MLQTAILQLATGEEFCGKTNSKRSREKVMQTSKFMVGSKFALLTLFLATFMPGATAQGNWAVVKTLQIGGDGGWDYVTVDKNTKKLYVPRSTHTMIIDTESGKVVADIPGQKRNHGVAIVPEAGRGFISDGGREGAVVIFDLKTN